MPTITIDNMSYDVDTLSTEAKQQLQSLQFVDAETSPPASPDRRAANRPHGVFQSPASGAAVSSGTGTGQ